MTIFRRVLVMLPILAAVSLQGLWADNNPVTVKRIKLEIGNEKYIWEGEELPDAVDGSGLTPATVLSFTSLRPGMKTEEEGLNREVELFRARLNESGMFYSAEVVVVPPRTHPESRTITVRVIPGFLMRFGGGNAYGFFGNKSINGSRTEWGLTAGVNTAGFGMIFHNAFGRNIYINPHIYYENHLLRDAAEQYHKLEAGIDAGKYITPDILVGAGGSFNASLLPGTTMQPDFEYTVYGFASLKLPRTNVMSGALSVETPLIFTCSGIIPSLFTTGTLEQEIPIFRFQQTAGLHYLWGEKKSSLLEEEVRTLPEDTSLFCSAEAGVTVLDEVFFSILHTEAEIFCFGELGAVNDYQSGFSEPMYGTGAGMALRLKEPVFMTLELFINKNNTDSERLQFRIKGEF